MISSPQTGGSKEKPCTTPAIPAATAAIPTLPAIPVAPRRSEPIPEIAYLFDDFFYL